MQTTVVLQRLCKNNVNEETLQKQIDHIIRRALTGARGKGWSAKRQKLPPQHTNNHWTFSYKLYFERSKENEKSWAHVLFWLMKAGNQGSRPWKVISPENKDIQLLFEKYEIVNNVAADDLPTPGKASVHDAKLLDTDGKHEKQYANVSFNREGHFDHIFDREPQIERIISAIQTAVDSDMVNRFHCVLFGDPGCGKTEVALATCKMLGKENEAYYFFDATSTSKAGVEKFLLDKENLIPIVLFIEEVEKTSEDNLRWLLGVLDRRAEIRKLNYRINAQRSCPMLVIATVNNINLFRTVLSGALASRFPNQLYFPRPSREIMKRILVREVGKAKHGKLEWVDPALDFAEMLGITDPRVVIPLCLCGKNDLLTGRYQQWYLKTLSPETLNKLTEEHRSLLEKNFQCKLCKLAA